MTAGDLRAGFARTDITPELGVRLGGYGVRERPAEAIADSLHATAMVCAQGDDEVAVLSLDWICLEERWIERIRAAVQERTGIPAARVTVSCTHTHSAPNTLNFWGWGEMETDYAESMLPKIVAAAVTARERLRPVRMGVATTASRAGVNRRRITEEGKVHLMADPHGLYDPTLTVAHFQDAAGAVGICVHYGAHGTAMGNNRLVSRDWCGVMKDRIATQWPVPVLFLNGAIGDVGPRTSFRRAGGLSAGTGDGLHAVREVGYRAAADAIRALLSIKEWRTEVRLNVLSRELFLPYAPLPSLEEAEQGVAQWAARKEEWGAPMCEYEYHRAVVEAHQHPVLKGRPFTQTLTAIGPLVLVPMPGELFSGIALRLREGSPYPCTLCCSVTNGSLSYLPTREARMRGGYEIWAGKAAGAYLLDTTIDDVLVAGNLKLLRELHDGLPAADSGTPR